jgi:D-alanyl-D-alanine carboxypeptidase/D-alanyl-D-alanine-endopeptidase (penicillin-binding protein 4)
MAASTRALTSAGPAARWPAQAHTIVRMPRPPAAAPVAVAILLALVASLVTIAPVAADTPATTSSASPAAVVTPVLSARRVPGLLAAHQADVALRAALEPILSRSTPDTCLTVQGTGRTIERVNGDKPLTPASLQKLLTATAVLDRLGEDGLVTTRAVAEAGPEQGVLDGDLWVVGSGDPLLATTGYLSTFDEPDEPYNDFAKLADAIEEAGITEIRGRIVGDESKFDAVRYLPSWPKRYIADNEVGPLSSLMVNDGYTGLSQDPEAPASDRRPGDPAQLAAETLTSLLEQRGVGVAESPSTGVAPGDATTIASLDSLPMSTNVREMIRQSDNTTAEVLVKDLVAGDGEPGTTEAGVAAVQETLSRLGLPTAGSVTTDGSGLDLGNRVTCDLMAAALDELGADSSVSADLPVAGETGTLRKRMRGTAAQGKVRAKTGTLREVNALAGFVESASGEVLTFALIINGSLPTALTLTDQVGVALAEYGEGVSLAQLSPASG